MIEGYRLLEVRGTSKRFQAYRVEMGPEDTGFGTLYLMHDELPRIDAFMDTVRAIAAAWPFELPSRRDCVLPEPQVWKNRPWFIVPDSLPVLSSARWLGRAEFAQVDAQLRWLQEFPQIRGLTGKFAHGDVRAERIALLSGAQPSLLAPGWVAAAELALGRSLAHTRADDAYHLAKLLVHKLARTPVADAGLLTSETARPAERVAPAKAARAEPRPAVTPAATVARAAVTTPAAVARPATATPAAARPATATSATAAAARPGTATPAAARPATATSATAAAARPAPVTTAAARAATDARPTASAAAVNSNAPVATGAAAATPARRAPRAANDLRGRTIVGTPPAFPGRGEAAGDLGAQPLAAQGTPPLKPPAVQPLPRRDLGSSPEFAPLQANTFPSPAPAVSGTRADLSPTPPRGIPQPSHAANEPRAAAPAALPAHAVPAPEAAHPVAQSAAQSGAAVVPAASAAARWPWIVAALLLLCLLLAAAYARFYR
jgi:hypothetical protein